MRRALLALAALTWPAAAEAACRQALALGLDVSGSVDAREYRLQLDGLAAALLRPGVQAAFLALPDAPVRLYVFEWAGVGSQREILPWTEVTGREVLAGIAGRLRATPRVPQDPGTAVGEAMLTGAAVLSEQPGCWRRTLDLSGDGQNNVGPQPREVRRDPRLGDTTVNALVIGVPRRPDTVIAGLEDWFRIEVIRGPEAFVEIAAGFRDFEDAMARKLLKELRTQAIGALERPQ